MRRIGMFGLVLAASSAFAADGVSVGGFVDAQWGWSKRAGVSSHTFGINDGAVYLNGTQGAAHAMVDLPFMYSGTGNDFAIATNKAQAFVDYKYDNGFWWKLGQFDSIFGAEGKDSVAIRFARAGLITTQVMPRTHTGVALGYWLTDEWNATVLVSNPVNQGQKAGGDNPEVGVKLGGKIGSTVSEISGAFLLQKQGSTTNWLADGILGLEFDELHLRGEAFAKRAGGATALGIGGTAAYDFSSAYTLALRLAAASKQGVTDKKLAMTVGPQFKVTQNLVAKVDYTLGVLAGEGSVKTHAANVAAVYKF